MKPLPTDLEILNAIYNHHYNEFAHNADAREKKPIVEIDIPAIADRFGVDHDIVFGRLYYHLDPRHRYVQGDGNEVRMFLPRTEFKKLTANAVHFPYLASVLAEMRAEERRRQTQTRIAWISLAVSSLAVVISFLTLLLKK